MNRFIEIQLTKYRVFLTESELSGLLAKDPDLWLEAIRRGKSITRAKATASRNIKLPKKVKAGGHR